MASDTVERLLAAAKQMRLHVGVLRAMLKEATPPPWVWSTSNSLRRLSSGTRDGDVAHAYTHPVDGVADIAISAPNQAYSEAAVNAVPHLLDNIERLADGADALAAENARLESLVRELEASKGVLSARVERPAAQHETWWFTCPGGDDAKIALMVVAAMATRDYNAAVAGFQHVAKAMGRPDAEEPFGWVNVMREMSGRPAADAAVPDAGEAGGGVPEEVETAIDDYECACDAAAQEIARVGTIRVGNAAYDKKVDARERLIGAIAKAIEEGGVWS